MGPTHLRLIRPTKQTNRTIELLPNLKIFHFEPRHLSVHVDFLPIISNPSPFLFFSRHQRKKIFPPLHVYTLHRLSPVTFTPQLATNPKFPNTPLNYPIIMARFILHFPVLPVTFLTFHFLSL